MHKKTALSFVHYGEPEKIEKSFAFNVDIFIHVCLYTKFLTTGEKLHILKKAGKDGVNANSTPFFLLIRHLW